MAFPSLDNLVARLSGGYRKKIDIQKSTSPAHTVGGWHMLAGNAGYPNAGTFPGTDLVFQSCWETTGDGTTVIGAQNGGVVAPGVKAMLASSAAIVAAAGAPWQLVWVDLQGYYRISTTNVTGTGSRTCINSNTFTASSSSGLLLTYTNDFTNFTKVRFTTTTTLPTGLSLNTDYYLVRVSSTTARVATSLANAIAGTVIAYTDAGTGTHTMTIQMRSQGGAGVDAAFVVVTAPTGGGPTITASNYTNESGTSGRAFQPSSGAVPSFGAAADAYATRIPHSGIGSGRYGHCLPKQGSDSGIQSINSFTLSGGSAYTGTGVMAVCLYKVLTDPIYIPATGVSAQVNYLNDVPSLPIVDDGACIVPLLFSTGATTNLSPLNGSITFGWSAS